MQEKILLDKTNLYTQIPQHNSFNTLVKLKTGRVKLLEDVPV
jgi:hypothetical protein